MTRPTKYRDEYPALAAVLREWRYTDANIAAVLRVGPSAAHALTKNT